MDRRRFLQAAAALAPILYTGSAAGSQNNRSGFDSRSVGISWETLAEIKGARRGESPERSKVPGMQLATRLRNPTETGEPLYVTMFAQFKRGAEEWRRAPCHPYYESVYGFKERLRDIIFFDRNTGPVTFFLPHEAWYLAEPAQVRVSIEFYGLNNQHYSEFDATFPGPNFQPMHIQPTEPEQPLQSGAQRTMEIILPAGYPPVQLFDVGTGEPVT